MNKLRWGKFYWSDWADDPALALCSLAAQGLWMRLLCLAAQGTPYGHVTINGKPATSEQLGRLIRTEEAGDHPTRYVARMIAELERNGVAARSETGCLISRRMVRDGHLAQVRHNAAMYRHGADKRGKNSGHQTDTKRTANGHQTDSERPAPRATNSYKSAEISHSGDGLHMQNPGFASTELDTELDADPPTPKPKSRTQRGKQDGAWTGHAKRDTH